MPYHPEMDGAEMQVGNGSEFPFSLFEGEKGSYVVAFSCGERAEEGLRKGEVPPNTFLTALVNGRDLCAMLGAMNFGLLLNKSCRTGELQVNGEFLRDLADGTALQASPEPAERRTFTLYAIDPADYPTAVVQAAFEKMRQHSAFRAGWLLAQETEAGPVYCVTALINPASEQLRHELNLVVQLARDDKALEVNVTALELDEPENVAGAFRQFPETFYLAPGFDPQKPLE
ncbi:MAG: hypothetical protein ABI946_08115 [Chthoniobacterales bacterium]